MPPISRSAGRDGLVSTRGSSSCWRAIASSTGRSDRSVRTMRVSLLDRRRAPRGLLLAHRPLASEHLLLRTPGPSPLLAADACPLARCRLRHPTLARLELLEQEAACEEAVQRLGALALAADDDAARPVPQHDARRNLVHVLPSRAPRADELLVEVLLAHAEPAHRLREHARLLGRDGEHYRVSMPGTPVPPRPGPAAKPAAPARRTATVPAPRRGPTPRAPSRHKPQAR